MMPDELRGVADQIGLPRYAATQIAQWLYKRHATTIDAMTNLPKAARAELARQSEVGAAAPQRTQVSRDGTEKYLFPTADGQAVETVYIPSTDGQHKTLCVSTQVGCKMNCLFCQTGKQGFHGNLTAADILAQVLWAEREKGLTNLVLMGQGEPFDNLDAVLRALTVLTADWGLAWSPRRITVSTVGLRKNLRRYLDDSPCHLAVSLHHPTHEGRLALMPAERQMPIADIVDTLRQYDFAHQRRLSFEYILFAGINDSRAHADQLLRLLRGLDCRVNLIRYHAIPGIPLRPATEESVLAFRDHLTTHGLYTTVRASRGQDIFAACGLLSTADKTARQEAHDTGL